MPDAYDAPLAGNDTYETSAEHLGPRFLSTLRFYLSMMNTVRSSARLAKRGKYDGRMWAIKSVEILRGLERAGVHVSITGLHNLTADPRPAVVVANHMSTLETFVLPGIVNPVRTCTFVIKPSLMDYPVFGHVMRSRNPIVVSRDNPRQDPGEEYEQGTRYELQAQGLAPEQIAVDRAEQHRAVGEGTDAGRRGNGVAAGQQQAHVFDRPP